MTLIIDHIIEYQNNYTSSYLFRDNLLTLLEAEISIIELLKSKVFEYEIGFDEWPQVHSNTEKMTVPYNGSVFQLRAKYHEVFECLGDEEKADRKGGDDGDGPPEPLYRMTYKLNLLPAVRQLDPDGPSLIALLCG